MLVDAHSHWLPEEIIVNAHFYHKGWGDIESHLKVMDEAGIDCAILSYPTSNAHLKLGNFSEVARIFNDNVGRIIKKSPKRFIGAAVIPVDNESNMLKEANRAIEELGFKAISLATSYDSLYLDQEKFHCIYRFAEKNNIPIFVHPQIVNPIGFERVQDPLLTPVIEYVFDTTISIGKLLTAGILRDYRVKFIFASFGGVIPFLAKRFDATYKMLREVNFVEDLKGNPTDFLKNIYVDTAGDTTGANFKAALELLGPKHILWGSDYPAKKGPVESIRAVKNLKISEKDKEDILGKNLKGILP